MRSFVSVTYFSCVCESVLCVRPWFWWMGFFITCLAVSQDIYFPARRTQQFLNPPCVTPFPAWRLYPPPNAGTSTERTLQGKIVHPWVDADAPVLIRNVSQHLTASVSHSLGQKRKHFFLSITQSFTHSQCLSLTQSMLTFFMSHTQMALPWGVMVRSRPLAC